MNAIAVTWIAVAVWVSWPDMPTWQRIYIALALALVSALFIAKWKEEERWKHHTPSTSRCSRRSSNT